ncbi:hypothetical protein C9422_22935 [Pseudomonas sp. B1(2018)]|jgi:hypothetical protein|uniref:DUF3077 domain-containing protein n=1 Tax=Pseudomonas sp. B1(2018) TaxID=2233856 RepID=UPI000D5D37B2|nr:DUF3077 domain-containing protein [Pseudomonas sp. B1(2018)]PVZ55041.1 hypothetical protein C9422_22935 [Pseudomonas sp. B1(2018)]
MSTSAPSELKTVGFTPFLFLSDQPLFHVCRDVPIADALAQASDLLFLAKSLTVDAAYTQDSDRHAWAAHYLTTMSKAVIDDVVKVLTRRPAGASKDANR